MQRVCKKSHAVTGMFNDPASAPRKAIVPMPMADIIRIRHKARRWLPTADSRANTPSSTRVAIESRCANAQDDTWLTSIMQTMKSSLMSRCTVSSRLAPNSIISSGMNLTKSCQRWRPSSVTRLVRAAISAAVGAGNLVIIHPMKHSRGKATAPTSAGIQNSLTPRSFKA